MHQDASAPLTLAAEIGHLLAVEYLLERGADMNAKDNVNDVMVE